MLNQACSRRRWLIGTLKTAGAMSLLTIANGASAQGSANRRLGEDDAQARALDYVLDASDANRTDKAGVAGSEQFCHNCRFIQADNGEWRPCQIFPGKLVKADGWCKSWAPM